MGNPRLYNRPPCCCIRCWSLVIFKIDIQNNHYFVRPQPTKYKNNCCYLCLSMYYSDQKDNVIQIHRFIHTTSLLTCNALAFASSAVNLSSALGSKDSLLGPNLPL